MLKSVKKSMFNQVKKTLFAGRPKSAIHLAIHKVDVVYSEIWLESYGQNLPTNEI